MTSHSIFAGRAARLRQHMVRHSSSHRFSQPINDETFASLALDWFAVQFEHNAPYQRWCKAAGATPERVTDWTGIPAMPASAFKELELTSLPAARRTSVFHSSGTTGQRPGRHFHDDESLALYEASLLAWFRTCLLAEGQGRVRLLSLTPSPAHAPHSSLVHMFETLRRELGLPGSGFFGGADAAGAWTLASDELEAAIRGATGPVMLLGTAFSYVNWLDALEADGRELNLPPGSRVLETGGYKGRSRALPKPELHQLIGEKFGVSKEQIVCEYGMSELSSQAYDARLDDDGRGSASRSFQFPPWARVRVVSPETGREVGEGEAGLVRVFDLANLWSVSAVQTEDLAVRRRDGFELIGRAAAAETRGCSLMPAGR